MNVDKLIVKTFKKAVDMMKKSMMENKECKLPSGMTKIIYPCYSREYRNGDTRISEQEIKQLFIQTLIEEKNDFYFSIETPTESKYKFSNSAEPSIYNEETDRDNIRSFESARFDLCLYQYQNDKHEFAREHLIEFKANNPDVKNIKKDFLKLFYEGRKSNQYFIHVIDNYAEKTEKSINDKYPASMKYCMTYFKDRKKEDIYQQKDINIYLLILNNKFNNEPDSDSKPHYFRISSHGTTWEKIRLEEDGSFSFENYEPLKN